MDISGALLTILETCTLIEITCDFLISSYSSPHQVSKVSSL
jgi:hypothetical protein